MENHGLIFEKISKVMESLNAISKDRKNTQQNYQFRGIDDVYNEIHPVLAENKVFTCSEILEERSEERSTKSGTSLIYRVLKIRYRFYTTDGSFVDTQVIGEGMDSGDKASNKAMAVAHKYAMLQMFCIPTDDEKDPENNTPAPSNKKQNQGDSERPKDGASASDDIHKAFSEIIKPIDKPLLQKYLASIGWLKADESVWKLKPNHKQSIVKYKDRFTADVKGFIEKESQKNKSGAA